MIEEAKGYFGPDSITWQLYREPLVLTGGLRALLLQIAQPSVADGVARFSNFKADPFGRGYRTFAAMAMIYFGSKTQAEQTAQRLWRIHSAIKGEGYSANQPDLLLWVLATLTDTTLRVFERMPLAGLPPDWRERFYEESKIAAQLLGIPKETYPVDLQAFEAYFEKMLHSQGLGSTDTCREVAQSIVRHRYMPERMADLLLAGWLPGPLCARLGIATKPSSEAKSARFFKRFVWFYARIPGFLRWCPAYHQARYRIVQAVGKRPGILERCFHWLGTRFKVPMGLEGG
jgi:uncharacterized protein (DUF2236 family)